MFTNIYNITMNQAESLTFNKALTPSFSTLVIGAVLFLTVVFATVRPLSGNIFYQSFLELVPVMNNQGREVNETFITHPPFNPDIVEKVITRKDMLQRLQAYLSRLTPPSGLQCEPHGKGPTTLAVEAYLKRIQQSIPEGSTKTIKPEAFEKWVATTKQVFTYVCKERVLVSDIIDHLHQERRLEFSFNEVRNICSKLLRFYEKSYVDDNRFRSRKEVNQILEIPIGERDPRNETVLKGINSFNVKTSNHDTGDNQGRPTDTIDSYDYRPINLYGDSYKLPTQTNELKELQSVAESSIPRASTDTRGGNT